MANRTKAGSTGKKRRVLVYCGGDPAIQGTSYYFLNLFWKVTSLCRAQGLVVVPVFDNRPPSMLETISPKVARLLDTGGVDGIIGFMLYESMVKWMKKSRLPFSVQFMGTPANHVDFDDAQMIDLAFARLAELGCKSVGLMIPTSMAVSDLLEHMDEVGHRLKLEVNYEWILVSRKSHSLSGYNHFHSLWALKRAPDGLVVFPDVMARGVVTALLEKNVKVPNKLKLILHRNEDAPYSVPMPCDWVENSSTAMANALVAQLQAQWAKKKLKRIRVPFRLVKSY